MQTEKLKDDVSFSIPSGNYGNLFSCLLSRKLGLPIKNIISANNINNPVEKYILTGKYKPQPSKRTLSNAMDVGSPSNFVRVKELFESNLDRIRQVMYGYSFSDSETAEAIKELIDKYKYTCDPHGAIGYLGAKKHLINNPQSQIIFLETAHHSKFHEETKSFINQEFEMPIQLKNIIGKVSNSVGVNDFNEFREYVKLTAS
jgi:threonine synthase